MLKEEKITSLKFAQLKWPSESVMGWIVYPQKAVEVLIPVTTEFNLI